MKKKVILAVVFVLVLVVVAVSSFLLGAKVQYTLITDTVSDTEEAIRKISEILQIDFPDDCVPEIFSIDSSSGLESILTAKIRLPGEYDDYSPDSFITEMDGLHEPLGEDDSSIGVVGQIESIPDRLGSRMLREYAWYTSPDNVYSPSSYHVAIVQKDGVRYLYAVAYLLDDPSVETVD